MSKSNQADNILDMIKARQDPNYKQPVKEIKSSDWYKFTSNFVEEMDGNKVNKETGMTNKEYLDYLKDRNSIAGSSVDQDQKDWQIPAINSTKKLREWLASFGEEYPKFNEKASPLFEGLEEDYSNILEEPDTTKKG